MILATSLLFYMTNCMVAIIVRNLLHIYGTIMKLFTNAKQGYRKLFHMLAKAKQKAKQIK